MLEFYINFQVVNLECIPIFFSYFVLWHCISVTRFICKTLNWLNNLYFLKKNGVRWLSGKHESEWGLLVSFRKCDISWGRTIEEVCNLNPRGKSLAEIVSGVDEKGDSSSWPFSHSSIIPSCSPIRGTEQRKCSAQFVAATCWSYRGAANDRLQESLHISILCLPHTFVWFYFFK